jgi:hypothetical protein
LAAKRWSRVDIAGIVRPLHASIALITSHLFSLSLSITSTTMTDEDLEQIIMPLEAGSEWRFELEPEDNIALRVSTRRQVNNEQTRAMAGGKEGGGVEAWPHVKRCSDMR